jgi:hypothetical protein
MFFALDYFFLEQDHFAMLARWGSGASEWHPGLLSFITTSVHSGHFPGQFFSLPLWLKPTGSFPDLWIKIPCSAKPKI